MENPNDLPPEGADATGAEEDLQSAAGRKLAAALSDPENPGVLLVAMRIENSRIEYSVANRPDPTLSGITDAILMAAIIGSGRFDFRRRPKIEAAKRLTAIRFNGERISYKDQVEIDFNRKRMRSTRKRDLTLKALSIVIQNLATSTAAAAQAAGPSTSPGDRAN
jgi:hypothetical protein